MEERLDRILALMEDMQTAKRESDKETHEIILQSEARIDRVNNIVSELSKAASDMMGVCKDLSQKYVCHIDGLVAHRDRLQAQNDKLVDNLSKMSDDLREERRRTEEMFRLLVSQACGRSDTNINVK